MSAIAALSLHGAVGLWVLQAHTSNSTSPPAVIEVIALPVAQPQTRPDDPLPTATPSDSEPLAETAPAQQSVVSPASVPVSPGAIAAPQSVADQPPPNPPASSPNPPSRPPTNPTTPAAAPSPSDASTGPGLQTLWTLRSLPAGRDLPDQLPQLSERWTAIYLGFDQEPCLAGQDWTALGSVTVGLHLTVEVDGRISRIRPWESSGDLAYDAAMTCAVDRLEPILEPALTLGEPIASDVLLEVTGSPRQ
jgi:outer membrane biosynthesis protein TonB